MVKGRQDEKEEREMKKQTEPNIKAHLLRGAFYLLVLSAVCVIPFALGQRTVSKQSAVATPLLLGSAPVSPLLPNGCTPVWLPGPNMPSPAVRSVGVYFPTNGKFYAMGGRSSDVAGSDFTNPFEYDPASNSWVIKGAIYPDNQVNNMACTSTA